MFVCGMVVAHGVCVCGGGGGGVMEEVLFSFFFVETPGPVIYCNHWTVHLVEGSTAIALGAV